MNLGVACLLWAVIPTWEDLRVDPGVQALPACSLTALAFADEEHGWATDACGTWWRSRDGGRSWAGTPDPGPPALLADGGVDALVWLDERNGVALRHHGRPFLRTGNGGDTWLPSEGSTEARVLATSVVGYTLWACGSGPTLARTDSAGHHWSSFPLPLAPGDACTALDFASSTQGWLGSRGGRLWRTRDGGATWEPRVSPAPGPVVALAHQEGPRAWVRVDRQAFRTVDDGGTWQRVEIPPGRGYGRREGAGWTARERFLADPTADMPVLDGVTWSPRGARGGAGVQDGEPVVFQDGERRFPGPLVSPPTAASEVLVGRAWQGGRAVVGWSRAHVYLAPADASGWYAAGALPPGTQEVLMLGPDLLALGADGSVQVSPARAPLTWTPR